MFNKTTFSTLCYSVGKVFNSSKAVVGVDRPVKSISMYIQKP